MAVIYAEDWAAGNSLFGTVYRYNRTGVGSEAQDPLYPYMWVAEGVNINGDGRLDKNPVYTDEFETYQQAGIWLRGAGPFNGGGSGIFSGSGFWDGTVGCIEATYYPTTESLSVLIESTENVCPLIHLANPAGLTFMGVTLHIEDETMDFLQQNEGEHPDPVTLTGIPMPVAGEAYTVRIGWQCGTFDPDLGVTAPDGFIRLWINDELIYEASDISFYVAFQTDPANLLDSVQFGYFGLLGPLDNFTINDSACASATPLPFRSGGTEYPLAWMEITRKELP